MRLIQVFSFKILSKFIRFPIFLLFKLEMFNFAADFDVSYETLKTTIANLDVSKEAKYDHGYSWPLFKKWFAA